MIMVCMSICTRTSRNSCSKEVPAAHLRVLGSNTGHLILERNLLVLHLHVQDIPLTPRYRCCIGLLCQPVLKLHSAQIFHGSIPCAKHHQKEAEVYSTAMRKNCRGVRLLYSEGTHFQQDSTGPEHAFKSAALSAVHSAFGHIRVQVPHHPMTAESTQKKHNAVEVKAGRIEAGKPLASHPVCTAHGLLLLTCLVCMVIPVMWSS